MGRAEPASLDPRSVAPLGEHPEDAGVARPRLASSRRTDTDFASDFADRVVHSLAEGSYLWPEEGTACDAAASNAPATRALLNSVAALGPLSNIQNVVADRRGS
jgi:hypothetical protein